MRIEGVGVFLVAVVELNGLVDVLIVLLVGGQDEVGFEGVLYFLLVRVHLQQDHLQLILLLRLQQLDDLLQLPAFHLLLVHHVPQIVQELHLFSQSHLHPYAVRVLAQQLLRLCHRAQQLKEPHSPQHRYARLQIDDLIVGELIQYFNRSFQQYTCAINIDFGLAGDFLDARELILLELFFLELLIFELLVQRLVIHGANVNI